MMHQATAPLTPALVTFTLNGTTLVTRDNQTILQVASEHGIEIPRLCYMDGMRADGNCRTCMVEIKGERVLAPSCCRYPKDGMEVTTNSARAVTSQKMSIELLLSDVPETVYTLNSELDLWAKKMSIGKPRFRARRQPVEDVSHPAIDVHLDACIQCKRCVRACREEQVNDVIGYAFRGGRSKIVFDLDDPMGESTCVACGECVQHRHRLTKPLIRKPGVPKHKDFTVDPEQWSDVFREATWEEALDLAASGLRDARDTYGKRALAGFGSAKGTNEEAYLFQKLVRTGFGSNNVDHCTRLCHAS